MSKEHQGSSFSTPSVIGENLFIPNPMYAKVLALTEVDLSELYAAIDVDNDDIEYLMERYGDLLDQVIDGFENTPEVAPTMPPAPQAQNIYNRTAVSATVHDLGSGDGRKAAKSQSKVTMFDKNPQAEHVVRADVDDMEFSDDVLYTSYNSLTQFKPETVARLAEQEGLHVVPDVNYLRDCMGSTYDDEGRLITRGEREVYVDYDHNLRGDEICTGYHVVNTYQRDDVRFEFGDQVSRGDGFVVPIRDTLNELPSVATPKYDGVAVRIRGDGKNASLSLRNGRTVKGNYRGPCMDILLEKLPQKGPAEAYVLIRILFYKNRVPYHGLNGLREFTARVKIKIDGVCVRAPGEISLSGRETDGLIYRIEGSDYRLKNKVTIDVYFGRFVEMIRKWGLDVTFLGDFGDKRRLMEISVERLEGGTYICRFERYRDDKGTPTTEDTVARYMEMAPVIAENRV